MKGEWAAIRNLLNLMLKGAAGPVASFLPLFGLPLAGAYFLPTSEFAIWAIFATVSSVAISLDFGGMNYLMARIAIDPRGQVLKRAAYMSTVGSMAVGAVGACAWIPYSRLDVAGKFGAVEGALAIGLLGSACAGRSVLQILSQAALFDRRFFHRNSVLLGQSVLTFISATILAAVTESAWSLPIGWALGASVTLVFALPSTRADLKANHRSSSPAGGESVRDFVVYRTTATVLGAALVQADRWILGALGGPVLLSTYEVAWRLATLPRFLLQNLLGVVGTDAASTLLESVEALALLMHRSLRIAYSFCAAAAIFVVIGYAVVPQTLQIPTDWRMFLAIAAAHSLLGVTAVVSLIGSGLAMPSIDVPYLSIAVVCMSVSALMAWLYGDPFIFIYGLSASLVASSLLMLTVGRRRVLRKAYNSAT